MKRFIYALMPVFVLALSATAFAQGGKPLTSDSDMTETVGVTISGGVEVDYVHRNGELFTLGTGAPGTHDGDNAIEGQIKIQIDVELTDSISAGVIIGNYRLPYTSSPASADGLWSDGMSDIDVLQAWIHLGEVFNENLSLSVGLLEHSFNPRGKGGAFFFDPYYSANFLQSGTNGPAIEVSKGEGALAGFIATYARETVEFNVFYLTKQEGGVGIRDDETIYGLDLMLDLSTGSMEEGSQFGGIVALVSGAGLQGSLVISAGIGANLVFGALEVFGEVYFNFGDTFDNDTSGPGSDEGAGGLGLRLGAQYNLSGDRKPWLELQIVHLSGDDDALDDDRDSFLSYESIDDTLVIENQYTGANVRSNYLKIQLRGGVGLQVGSASENNLALGVVIAYFILNEEIGPVNNEEDGLGIELDLTASYAITKQANFNVGIGVLFASDVLETLTGVTVDEESTTWVISIGTDIGF